jgi:hypothetical protein
MLILSAVLGAVGCSGLLALAFGRAAAHADLASDLLLLDRSRLSYAGTAGLAAAHEAISCEPSITVPSSSRSVGTVRLPVKRSTS